MVRLALSVLFGLGLAALVCAGAEWEPVVRMNGHLFPSYAIATSTIDGQHFGERPEGLIGDLNGQLGITLTSPADDTPFVLEIAETSLFGPSKLKGTLATAGTTYTLYPTIAYDFDALRGVRQTAFLETTMIGNTDLSGYDADDPDSYKAMVGASGKSFLGAIEHGRAAFEEHAEMFKDDDEAGDQTHHLIAIDGARELGIRAIAYKAKED